MHHIGYDARSSDLQCRNFRKFVWWAGTEKHAIQVWVTSSLAFTVQKSLSQSLDTPTGWHR